MTHQYWRKYPEQPSMMNWQPIETKPPLTHVEERGEYRTDDGMLWYFKPTHWRPLRCCDNYPSCYCDQERHVGRDGQPHDGPRETCTICHMWDQVDRGQS